MSFCVKKILQFSQGGLEYIPHLDNEAPLINSLPLLGGVLRDTRYVWQAKGPILEVRNTKTGTKIGAWTFGGILKGSNSRVVCVNEIPRPNGRISLLAVGIDCTINGGIICIFDVFSSKVIRAIQVREKIVSLHTIDPGIEDLNLPGPLRNFDGILAAGTEGGEVILIDICRQICEESLHTSVKRDELNPAPLVLLTANHIPKIEHYKERAVRDGNHLAIHLNAVIDNKTEHFVLKGPKNDDRIHVNKTEVVTSTLYYCPQLTSLLVGYNFGAFQLWDLTTLKLVYTSPVCDEHIPITSFALQEPTDDPRAFCYIWVAYGNTELYQTGLPYAVMYSLCYESKEYQEGYGYLYQDFHYCTIRFQVELGQLNEHRSGILPKGGFCLGFQPITKLSTSKESCSQSSASDTLALCLISWTIWFSKTDAQTCCLVFDLNQWYKEQMPSFTQWKDSTNYILVANLSELIQSSGHKGSIISNVLMDTKSLTQFVGIQRLEEHFYPSSLSFSLWVLREFDVVHMTSQGLQKLLLSQIESAGPLCLVRPTDVCRQALTIGLTPLFVDLLPNRSLTTESQREIVLNLALEHQLIGWLCKCASEWANGSFSSAGCSLDFIITWALQRAVTLKNNCDRFCVPLFDYSESRLDGYVSILLNSCTRQINSLCVLYKHIVNKLYSYVGCLDLIKEHYMRLEMVSIYFEVLQWLVNVGLLPECHPSAYPRPDNSERISAPYPAQELNEYYNEKRAELRLLSKETFENNDSLLFIDNLIERKCGGGKLQKQWQEDGGSGLYPPPSLQSLIRTYLVDGAGISHKHSLVIYLFLDLAMALDQSRYSSVVTHLIKFPAVFKVSPSIIKITQAFWQLDHGDFTTAMEQLLDPFVLGEDLQSWHHTIAMRSLLIHKQPNFALLYMQIRKPPITDEKDILTALSLFIANNMLDEAFYFKKQHQNNNEEKLLAHLFHECSKNDALHMVLYKCLNTDEEKAFFKYLKSVANPTSDDLQIFYYLLRSRFIEAFDTHSKIKRKCPERQGLIGQSMASKTDQIVKIFKTLLPDVNKNLVDYIRRERMNLWKEVQRPTPMSVFIHNTVEQVKYKSTLIHAALAKAKETFPENVNNSYYKDLITEDTPFLRTPTACRNGKRVITPVITPKIIDLNENADEVYGPPNKKMRISSRAATTSLSPQSPLKNTSESLMLTPIVKRKTSLQLDTSQLHFSVNICSPQSILKVRNLVKRKDSITDDTFQDEGVEPRGDVSLQSPNLHLQPRSLSHTPKRQHVQFDEATKFSTSLSDQSSRLLDSTHLEDQQNVRKSSLSSKDISSILSSSANDDVSDDVFYSPDNSSSEGQISKKEQAKSTDDVEDDINDDVEKDASEIKETSPAIESVNDKEVSFRKPAVEIAVGSPRARRSYKRSFGELSPTRSSPRLSKLHTKKEEPLNQSLSPSVDALILEKQSISDNSISVDSSSPRPSRIVPKLKGRKSLSRQVLEHNAFSKFLTAPIDSSTVISKESSFSKSEKITITEKSSDESKVTVVDSNLKIVDTEEKDVSLSTPTTQKTRTLTSSFTKKQESETTIYTDSSFDSDSSYQYGAQEDSGTKLSDSLQEYIDFILSSGKKVGDSERFENKKDMSQVKLDFTRENVAQSAEDRGEASGIREEVENDEKEPQMPLEEHEISSDIEEVAENKEDSSDKQKELDRLVNEFVESDDESNYVEEPIQVEADHECQILTELKPVELREPSPSRTEFVTIRTKVDDDVLLNIYGSSSDEGNDENYDQEISFNELEANIFELPGDEDVTFSKSKRSSHFTDTPSDSFNIPDSDLAFMEDPLTEHPELKTDNSIVVISSSDEDSSDKGSVNSAYSKTTEELHDDTISYSTDSTNNDISSNDSDDDKQDPLVFQYEAQDMRNDFIDFMKENHDKREPETGDVVLIEEDNFERADPQNKELTLTEASDRPQPRENLETTPTETQIKKSSESEIPSVSGETVQVIKDTEETPLISDSNKITDIVEMAEDPLTLERQPDVPTEENSSVLNKVTKSDDRTPVTETYIVEDKDVEMSETNPVLENIVQQQNIQPVKELDVEEDNDVEMVEAKTASENVESANLETDQLQINQTIKESNIEKEKSIEVDVEETSPVAEKTTGESEEPKTMHQQIAVNVESGERLKTNSQIKEIEKINPMLEEASTSDVAVKKIDEVTPTHEGKYSTTDMLKSDDSSSKKPIPKKRLLKLDGSYKPTVGKEEEKIEKKTDSPIENFREEGEDQDKSKKSEASVSSNKKYTHNTKKRLPKIDQSTNTSMITEDAPLSIPKERKEKSSNATIDKIEEDTEKKTDSPIEKNRETTEVPNTSKKSETNVLSSKKDTLKTKKGLPKIDHSTNTSIIAEDAPPSIPKEKTDQSSNTTIIVGDNTQEEKEKDVAKSDPAVKDIKKIYSRHKVSEGEQTTSSSDTTEGETYRKETVVADVHTPSMLNTPGKRVTRRKSTSAAPAADVDIRSVVSDAEESKNLVVEIERNDEIFSKNLVSRSIGEIRQRMGGKRTRRAFSTSDVPAEAVTTSNSDNAPIDCDPNRSIEIIDNAAMIKLTLRKKRSASVDVVKTFSRPRTAKRTRSIDEEVSMEEPKERRAMSMMQMPVISEENTDEDRVRGTRKTRSVVDTYATARRLTRRQANIVKEMTIATDAESVDDESKGQIDLDPIDPINLLDKEPFEGKPDPDENKVYESSSPPTSATSAQRSTRRSRSNSVMSDNSISPSLSVTPVKSSRPKRSQTKSPSVSGISTRSRKQSESSVVSEHSESMTPTKRSKKKTQQEDVEPAARSTRSRTGSISSVKSGDSSSRKVGRPRRLVSTKSDLPEITEEKAVDNIDESVSTSSKKSKSEGKLHRKK